MTLASLESFATVDEALHASEERVLEAIRPTITVDEAKGEIIASLPDGTSVILPTSMFQ